MKSLELEKTPKVADIIDIVADAIGLALIENEAFGHPSPRPSALYSEGAV